MPEQPPVDFLRPREVVRRTGLSRQRVYQDIHDGHLKAYKREGRNGRKATIHIKIEDYREYLKTKFKPL